MGSKVISRAALALAEDAEGARVAVDELEAGARVGGDGQADGDRGRGVGRAVDAPAEALAERAGDDRELARPADDVDAGDLGEGRARRLVVEAAHQGGHRLDGALHERSARVVEVGDGHGDLRAGRARPSAASRSIVTLREVGLSAPWPRGTGRGGAEGAGGEVVAREAGPREGDVGEDRVEVVAAEPRDAGRREDLVASAAHADERGVERAAAEVVDARRARAGTRGCRGGGACTRSPRPRAR